MVTSPILLIDDEPTMRELYRRVLASRGHAVITAASGEDALALIHEERPELVLSDVMMPGIGGFELCERLIRADEKRMPFLFLTANDNFSTLRDGLMAGGDDFLVKGVDLDLLEERVQFWLKSPLSALPSGPRGRAVDMAAAALEDPARAHLKPIGSLGGLREDLRTRALDLTRRAICEAGTDYFARAEVPLSFLGFVAGVLDTLTAGDLSALIRYPDYMRAVIGELAPAWLGKSRAVFAAFEETAADELFKHARNKGVSAAG